MKFDWTATESAPEDYPARIIYGALYYKNGALGLVPQASTGAGWGRSATSVVSGEKNKPLPTDFNILYYSIAEDTFYAGSFELPYERIAKLFKAGYQNPRDGKKTTYDQFMIGVAPGGSVAVWLISEHRDTEVFFGRADEVDTPKRTFFDKVANRYTREEYGRKMYDWEITPETQAYIKAYGVPVDRWQRYSQRYRWQPKVTMPHTPPRINRCGFYNGETDFYPYPISAEVAAETRAIPKLLEFTWRRPHGKDALSFQFTFDEAEIFAAFKTLSALPVSSAEPLYLHFQIIPAIEGKNEYDPNEYTIIVTLEHPQQTIKLTKPHIKIAFSL